MRRFLTVARGAAGGPPHPDLESRGPRRPTAVIHHSDQGCQYTSVGFGRRCQEVGVRPSMGSAGDCYDNAMAESFFATPR